MEPVTHITITPSPWKLGYVAGASDSKPVKADGWSDAEWSRYLDGYASGAASGIPTIGRG